MDHEPQFTTNFNRYVCEGDKITTTFGVFTATATLYHDTDSGPPDKQCDGFWPSIDPKDAGWIGSDKSPSDFKRQHEQATEVMRAWKNDEWHYFGVDVTVTLTDEPDIELTPQYSHALWGIEGNYPGDPDPNSYFTEVANENLPEAIKAATKRLAEIAEAVTKAQGALA